MVLMVIETVIARVPGLGFTVYGFGVILAAMVKSETH